MKSQKLQKWIGSGYLKRRSAFTLIEMMAVVFIIGLLLVYFIPKFGGNINKARKDTAKSVVRGVLNTALNSYEMENGNFPTTEQGLKALVEKPSSDPAPQSWRKYLEVVPLDPWQKDYVYVCPGVHNTDSYDLSSLGPDRAPSDDDINNW